MNTITRNCIINIIGVGCLSQDAKVIITPGPNNDVFITTLTGAYGCIKGSTYTELNIEINEFSTDYELDSEPFHKVFDNLPADIELIDNNTYIVNKFKVMHISDSANFKLRGNFI